MGKNNSLKKDHEETKLFLTNILNRNPVSEVESATVPLWAVVKGRIVSLKLGDLLEVPEDERLSPAMDQKRETNRDSTMKNAVQLSSGYLVQFSQVISNQLNSYCHHQCHTMHKDPGLYK